MPVVCFFQIETLQFLWGVVYRKELIIFFPVERLTFGSVARREDISRLI